MYQITVEQHFDAAHVLRAVDGHAVEGEAEQRRVQPGNGAHVRWQAVAVREAVVARRVV